MDVREAARRTLEAGTARVSTHAFFDPPVSQPFLAAMETRAEGVVDLSTRRARVETSLPGFAKLTERIVARWPWLDLDEDGEEDVEPDTVFIGGRRYLAGETCASLLHDGGSASGPDHPTWIVDALAGATGAHRIASEEVRGSACARYVLDPVDLRAAAENGTIVLPPHGSVARPTLRGEVWIDGEGLVRRAKWIQPLRGRPRLRPKQTNPTFWHSTELWDFGLPVTIEVPEAKPPPPDTPFHEILWNIGTTLWGMRRDYQRKRPQP
jgi:hypothetical protein